MKYAIVNVHLYNSIFEMAHIYVNRKPYIKLLNLNILIYICELFDFYL